MKTIRRLHLANFLALWFCGTTTGVVVGALINAVNVTISPQYFQLFFYMTSYPDWYEISEVRWRSVGQGLMEGTGFGLILATSFTVYCFAVSRSRCEFRFAGRYLPKMAAVVGVCWFIGAFNGALVGAFVPQFRDDLLTFMWLSQPGRVRYQAVGGAIYGVYFGCLLSLILGCAWFKKDWSARVKAEDQKLNSTPKIRISVRAFDQFRLVDLAQSALWGAAFGTPIVAVSEAINHLLFPDLYNGWFLAAPAPPPKSSIELIWEGVWQGLGAGAFYGALAGCVLAAYAFLASRARYCFKDIRPLFRQMMVWVVASWIISGLNGIVIGILILVFRPQPVGFTLFDALRQGFVIFSYLGYLVGAVGGLVAACRRFGKEWQAQLKAEAAVAVNSEI